MRRAILLAALVLASCRTGFHGVSVGVLEPETSALIDVSTQASFGYFGGQKVVTFPGGVSGAVEGFTNLSVGSEDEIFSVGLGWRTTVPVNRSARLHVSAGVALHNLDVLIEGWGPYLAFGVDWFLDEARTLSLGPEVMLSYWKGDLVLGLGDLDEEIVTSRVALNLTWTIGGQEDS
jgi:hypothetical protein